MLISASNATSRVNVSTLWFKKILDNSTYDPYFPPKTAVVAINASVPVHEALAVSKFGYLLLQTPKKNCGMQFYC